MDFVGFLHSHQAYFEDFVARSTHASNRIEGNTLTLGETYAILWNDNSVSIQARPRELYEAINHKFALSRALGHIDDPLTERLIKSIARDLCRNIDEADGYRTTAVVIRGAEFIPPAANEVNQLMMQLVWEYNQDDRDPFEREASFHIRFEHIHPFADGNGRTGRLLATRGLVRSGLAPAVIPAETRADYLQAIADYDVDGLASMLRMLSEAEERRMQVFAEAPEPPL